MTEVSFHFNVPDKVAYACRLLRKAQGAGSKVVVLGDAGLLRALDVALWTFSPLDFVAHSNPSSSPEVVHASPIQLVANLETAPHRQVILNLGEDIPIGFEAFARLIEIVSTEDADRASARQRWKRYAALGCPIVRHDVAAS